VHLAARRLTELSPELASVGDREIDFPVRHRRGDEVHHGGAGPDPRDLPPRGLRARDNQDPYGHIDQIRARTRDFR